MDAHDHDYAHLVSEQRRGDLTTREDMGPGAARTYNNAHNNAHNPGSLLDAVQRAQAAHRPRMAVQASGPGPGSASAPAPAGYVKPDSVDPINDFVEVAAGVLNSVIRRRHGLDVARLPMIPWTKAPPSLDGTSRPLPVLPQGCLSSTQATPCGHASRVVRAALCWHYVSTCGPVRARGWTASQEYVTGEAPVCRSGCGGHAHPSHHGSGCVPATSATCDDVDGPR